MPGHGIEQHGAVPGAVRHRTGLIQTGCKGHHAQPRHAAVGGFEAGDAAKGRRLPDRSAGVRTGCRRRQQCGNGGGRASGRAPWNQVGIPWISDRAIVAGFVGGTHGKLVHVGLAQQHRASAAKATDQGGIVGRHKVVQHARAATRAHARSTEDVLVRHRDTGQRCGVPCGQTLVRRLCIRQCRRFVYTDKAVVAIIQCRDAVQEAAGQFHAGKLPVPQTLRQFGDSFVVHDVNPDAVVGG